MLMIKLPALLSNLEKWITPISEFLKGDGLCQRNVTHIELALEEALVNVCRYAYQPGQGDIEVRCQIRDDRRYLIEIVDSGFPFDVCTLPTPELKACITERKVGGLGVHLIRKMTNEMTYRREGDHNILSLIFQAALKRNDGVTPFQPCA
jgi:serine/threonine-protein kinase RsbW